MSLRVNPAELFGEHLPGLLFRNVQAAFLKTGKNAENIAVDGGNRLSKRNGGDCARRVIADSGQGADVGESGREFSVVPGRNESCRLPQIPDAGIVAESLPEFQEMGAAASASTVGQASRNRA